MLWNWRHSYFLSLNEGSVLLWSDTEDSIGKDLEMGRAPKIARLGSEYRESTDSFGITFTCHRNSASEKDGVNKIYAEYAFLVNLLSTLI